MVWVTTEGDKPGRKLPHPNTDCARSTLPDLVHGTFGAGVLVRNPAIALNLHTDNSIAYLVRLINVAGRHQLLIRTREIHEKHWPPNDPTHSEEDSFYLQQICYIANVLPTTY